MKTRDARRKIERINIEFQMISKRLTELQLELLRIELATEPKEEFDPAALGEPLDVDKLPVQEEGDDG